jgi:hypothetical protein
LDAVIDPVESAALWVADPHPRAQAFYRKHGFVADATAQVEDGIREIHMIRCVQAPLTDTKNALAIPFAGP